MYRQDPKGKWTFSHSNTGHKRMKFSLKDSIWSVIIMSILFYVIWAIVFAGLFWG